MSKTTAAELLKQTAQLIAQCPEWCTEQHEPGTHPEDVVHRRTVGRTECGQIVLNVWPVPVGDGPSAELYLEGIDISLTFDRAAAFAGSLIRGIDALRMVTNGRDDQVARVAP